MIAIYSKRQLIGENQHKLVFSLPQPSKQIHETITIDELSHTQNGEVDLVTKNLLPKNVSPIGLATDTARSHCVHFARIFDDARFWAVFAADSGHRSVNVERRLDRCIFVAIVQR